jgi:2-dehydro-3-deoxygalactonokinase
MNKFLSCDWGTSSFRLRLVDARTGKISGEVISDEGSAETHRQWAEAKLPGSERIDFYRSILADSIRRLPMVSDKDIPVILSGMASSSIGLKELPYCKFPFHWDPSKWIVEKIEGDEKFSHPLFLVSGFQTDTDIMRGEETKLLGCEIEDDEERIFIFPGTHSKHVFVKNKTGIDFKTYMTGELFTLLSEKSILHHAVQKGVDEKAFADGIKAAMDGNILHELFGIRARQILGKADPASNYQWLSGLLIGTELKDLKNTRASLNLVCSENVKKAYRGGLKVCGLKFVYLNADEMLINGHCRIAAHYL